MCIAVVCVFLYSSFRLIVISVFGDFIARDAFIFLLWSHTSILIYCVLLVWLVCFLRGYCTLELDYYLLCAPSWAQLCAFKVVHTYIWPLSFSSTSSSSSHSRSLLTSFRYGWFCMDNRKFYILYLAIFSVLQNVIYAVSVDTLMPYIRIRSVSISTFPFAPNIYPKFKITLIHYLYLCNRTGGGGGGCFIFAFAFGYFVWPTKIFVYD